jgi:hypothetical protein
MRSLFTILLMVLSFNVFAVDTVRIDAPTNMMVTGVTDTSFTLGSDNPSGDATSESAPAKVYIPIQNTATGSDDYSTLNVAATLYNVTNASHTVTYPLLATTGGTAKYIYVAVKYSALGTSFYVMAKSTLISANQTNLSAYFNLAPKDICKALIANGNTACTNLEIGSSASTTIKPIIYFFLSSDNLDISGSTTIDPGTATGGVYFESQMSNRVYTDSDLQTLINTLKVGDKRLIAEFSSNATMDSSIFKKVIVFKYTDTTVEKVGFPTYRDILLLGGSLDATDVSTAQSGEFTLSGLTNNQTYNISIAFLDKFLFATTFSASRKGTPLEIQELLKKQACFLLTAGFGEEHYVISFFRGYRDQVLAHTWLGRKFITAYYKSAPHYADIIYQTEWMRLVIRSAAYCLYFLFNYYGVVLIFIGAAFLFNLSKIKILILKNRLE